MLTKEKKLDNDSVANETFLSRRKTLRLVIDVAKPLMIFSLIETTRIPSWSF